MTVDLKRLPARASSVMPMLVVLPVAFLLRCASYAAFADVHSLRGDEAYYVAQARSLVEHGSYPGALRPPLQSMVIAGLFVAVGESVRAARLFQIAISLLTVALVVEIASSRLGKRAAVAAGLLCSLHPTLLHYSHLLWSEGLYGLLLVATVCCLERFDRLREERWLFFAGASLGLAALSRETALYFAPIAIAWLLLGRRNGRPDIMQLRSASLVLISMCAIVVPWTLRNSLMYEAFVPISTNRWRMIAQGNVSPSEAPRLRARSGDSFVYRGERRPLERERIARALAVRAISARQPWWIVEKMYEATRDLVRTKSQLARYLKRGWLAPAAQRWARILVSIETVTSALLLAAGVAGLWLARAGRLQSLIAALIATHWAIYVVAFAHNRFLVPLLPLLSLMAGPLLTRWPPWRGARRWQLVGASASLLALSALLLAE